MAVRPLFNGAAMVLADNGNNEDALRLGYVFQVQTTDPITFPAHPTVITPVSTNKPFEVEAGVPITIYWAARKVGTAVGGPTNDPQDAHIRIFPDDDSNDVLTGAVFASGNVLPAIIGNTNPSGSVVWTPATSGTFRIQVEMRRGAGSDFGATSNEWRLVSDGLHQLGGASSMTRAHTRDKGRLRIGTRINAVTISERGSPKPSLFSFTSGGEAVRIATTTANPANKTSSVESFRLRQRRNGTSTIDHDVASTPQTTTVQHSETVVNDTNYSATVTSYDVLVVITSLSNLHSNNTRQYDGLTGRSASGHWVYFVGANAGNFIDYTTVEVINTHTVDPKANILHHFQVEDDVFSLAKNDPLQSMRVDQSGFLWSIVRNARNEGQNGINVTQSLDPVKPGDTIISASTTSTQAGVVGVSGALVWVTPKPSGTWNKNVDITSPSTIDADSYLNNATASYAMRAFRSEIVIIAGGGPTEKSSHFIAGVNNFQVGVAALNIITGHREPIDSDVTGALAFVALVRLQDSGLNAGLAEFLDQNMVWQVLPSGSVVDMYFHRCTQTRPGSGIYIRTWTAAQTALWGDYDVFVVSKVRIENTEYGNYTQSPAVGFLNDHKTVARAGWDQVS